MHPKTYLVSFWRAGSLWVAWVLAYYLHHKSFWQVTIPSSYSWTWRKLLKLRVTAQSLIIYGPEPDRIKWEPSKSGVYTAASNWDRLRTNWPKVFWRRLIWYSNPIPKHSFIAWIAILDSLNTLSRINSWGIQFRT